MQIDSWTPWAIPRTAASFPDQLEPRPEKTATALGGQRVGHKSPIPERARSPPKGAVEHRAGVGRPIGANPCDFSRPPVLQEAGDGATENSDAPDLPTGVTHSAGSDATSRGSVVTVVALNECIRFGQSDRCNVEAHSPSLPPNSGCQPK